MYRYQQLEAALDDVPAEQVPQVLVENKHD
jgi:hypothetical protein